MLSKLVKYDLKAGIRIIGATYGFIILCALFARITETLSGLCGGFMERVLKYLYMFSVFIMIVSIIAICVITLVSVILRYRNNLLRDEGYLMHTLPVSPVNLYFSKIITAIIFFLGDIVVIICAFILSGLPAEAGYTWSDFADQITTFHYGAKEYGVNGTIYIIIMIILFIVALYASIAQFFASLNIGYSISGKGASKDLISVAVYIVTYIISQVVMVLAIMVSVFIYGFELEEGDILKYTEMILCLVLIIMSVFSIVYSTISIKLMQKKLNLE